MVNPDGIANQIEGGLIQSLSWTLKEEVKFDETGVLSDDWESYPILTFSEVPPIDVVLIDRPGEPYLGTGEAARADLRRRWRTPCSMRPAPGFDACRSRRTGSRRNLKTQPKRLAHK